MLAVAVVLNLDRAGAINYLTMVWAVAVVNMRRSCVYLWRAVADSLSTPQKRRELAWSVLLAGVWLAACLLLIWMAFFWMKIVLLLVFGGVSFVAVVVYREFHSFLTEKLPSEHESAGEPVMTNGGISCENEEKRM